MSYDPRDDYPASLACPGCHATVWSDQTDAANRCPHCGERLTCLECGDARTSVDEERCEACAEAITVGG